MQGQLK